MLTCGSWLQAPTSCLPTFQVAVNYEWLKNRFFSPLQMILSIQLFEDFYLGLE